MEHHALLQITPIEARTLLFFMQALPEPQKLNPAMTWEESCHMDQLMDKIRLVLSYRASATTRGINKEVSNVSA